MKILKSLIKSLLIVVAIILIQSQGCGSGGQSTGTPLGKTKVIYGTYNSIRHIDQNDEENTIVFENDLNTFGLSFYGSELFINCHLFGPRKTKPKYKEYTSNDIVALSTLSTPTDIVDVQGTYYVAADYNVYKFTDIVNGAGTLISQPVTSPFALSTYNDFVFVTGVNQMAILNASNDFAQEISNFHEIASMSAFSCVDDQNNFYFTDVDNDNITMIPQSTLDLMIYNNQNTTVLDFTVSWAGIFQHTDPLLESTNLFKGPVGIDFHSNEIWVAVDNGTGIPGRILSMIPPAGSFTVEVLSVDDPRDIVVGKP